MRALAALALPELMSRTGQDTSLDIVRAPKSLIVILEKHIFTRPIFNSKPVKLIKIERNHLGPSLLYFSKRRTEGQESHVRV